MESSHETDRPRHDNGDPAGELKDQVASAASEAREQAADVAQSAKAQARRLAEQQKEAGANQLGGIAHAVDSAADELENQMPQSAEYIHEMADKLESAAKSLRERNVDDLLRQAGDLARQQPAMFFAGAVLTGFALSRFLKRSSAGREG